MLTFTTGTAAVAMAASALVTLSIFLVTTWVKSRQVRVIGGLRQPTASGDVRSPASASPAGSGSGSFVGSKNVASERNSQNA